jgi:hypothetical protein
MNDALVRAAERIALREGKVWTDCLADARNEVARQQPAPLRKVVDKGAEWRDAELRRKADLAKAQRLPGSGNPDPNARTEVGEVDSKEFGRLRLAVSRDEIMIHGVNAPLSDLDEDLRAALVSSSSAFSAAENEEEQTTQRKIIGIIVDAVLRRHEWLSAKVRDAKRNERFGV